MAISVRSVWAAMLLISYVQTTVCTSETTPCNETGVCEAKLCSKLEYYDKLKQKCRDFPGGGFLIIMDHHNYNFHQYVYQCPPGTFFHPDLQKCSSSNKCYEAQEDILHNFSKEYFPECHILGQFRTAKDCSLYYRCVPNMDGSFYQIRYE
uniref:Chitin-binding type-2 domain-containing protein n=1 Tax=Anopheles farauti TaxID=69004 RepID=A0A182QFP9_9DIPT